MEVISTTSPPSPICDCSSMSPAIDSVLHIGELANLICLLASPRDAARLGRTSHRFFDLAMPVAWRHIDGVVNVLRLIHGCQISSYDDDDGIETTRIDIPSLLSEDSFTRFKIYAPLVKTLEIFKSKSEPQYGVLNALGLISYTNNHELLPNLQRLTMNTEYSWKLAYCFWFRVFACRSLLEIRPIASRYHEPPRVPVPVISALIGWASERCPLLETLGIFAADESLSPLDHELEHLVISGDEEPLADVLLRVKPLTSIVGSPILLDQDVFLTLGRLPLLKRLEVYYSEGLDDVGVPLLRPSFLSDDSFPSLRHLTLHNSGEHDVDFLWKLPSFAHKLTTLEVFFDVNYEDINLEWVGRDFIPLLCQNSPQITQLTLDFNSGPFFDRDQPITIAFTAETFQAIATLPLTKLNVTKARLGFDGAVTRMATAWPRMEQLEWTAQHVKLEELYLFAENLPHLRRLAIEVDMIPLPEDIDLDHMKAFRRTTLSELEGSFHKICQLTPNEGYMLYRYLFTIWPNARLMARRDSDHDFTRPRQKDLCLLAFLNDYVDLVHAKKQIGDFDVEWIVKGGWDLDSLFAARHNGGVFNHLSDSRLLPPEAL